MAEKKKADPKAWLETYGDAITLVLCFFVILMGDPSSDNSKIQLVLASFGGLGPLTGGMTLSPGRLAQVGATLESLPADKRAKALEEAINKAISMMNPEEQQMIALQEIPERGLVITLMGDAFFRPGSAEVDIERTRSLLDKIAHLFNSAALANNNYRIEGYTDSVETSPDYYSRWELSAARAANVLHYLVDFGADESRFQIVGYADNRPVPGFTDSTPEVHALNRRVEIAILTDGHL